VKNEFKKHKKFFLFFKMNKDFVILLVIPLVGILYSAYCRTDPMFWVFVLFAMMIAAL
jgi:F0F1-type ATP synthase assembly protein I